MTIEVELTKPPTLREIRLECPGCRTSISRSVAIDQTEGDVTCGMCGAEFRWKEIQK